MDHPPSHPRPRWGFGQPVHPELHALMEQGRRRYTEILGSWLKYSEWLRRIPLHAGGGTGPCWINGYLPGLDALAIYGFIAEIRPKTYLEIGSGHSTRFARQAIRDHSLGTRILSIDPEPRASLEGICDQVIRQPLEAVDLRVFDQLESGDFVFLDGSHRVLTQSDVTVFFLEVLPRLKEGVLIQIHDVTLPVDYPEAMIQRRYSEQYMLAVLLLFGGVHFETVFPGRFVSEDPVLSGILDPFWSLPELEGVERHGCSYYLISR